MQPDDAPAAVSLIFRKENPSLTANEIAGDLIEEEAIFDYVQTKFKLSIIRSKALIKDKEICVDHQNKARQLFQEKTHAEETHEHVLDSINNSILYGPIDSEEYIYSIEFRANYLQHLRQHEASIEEYRKLLNITTDTKCRLNYLYQMFDCYRGLKKPMPQEEFSQILKLYKSLPNKCKKLFKKNFVEDIIKTNIQNLRYDREKQSAAGNPTGTEYLSFERHDKIPFASKAIDVIQNDKGEVRIVAARDIEPGEILVAEPKFKSFLDYNYRFKECSYCSKWSWNPTPCHECTTEVYCSNECRLKDWDSYHHWVCTADIEEESEVKPFLRFFFDMLDEAGGLDNFGSYFGKYKLKKGLVAEDFDSSKIKSYYSWVDNDVTTYHIRAYIIDSFCNFAYYLAKRTDYFGEKMKIKCIEVLKDKKYILLVAAMVRSYRMFEENNFNVSKYAVDYEVTHYDGSALYPFCRYIRHSCDPNTASFTSKNLEMVVFAKHQIKKGTKITLSYGACGTFVDNKTKSRQNYIKDYLAFECTCVACEKNWTRYHLKTMKVLLRDDPESLRELSDKYKPLMNILKCFNENGGGIPQSFIKNITDVLKVFNEKSARYTMEYELLFKFLHIAYVAHYGNMCGGFNVTCEKSYLYVNEDD